MTRRRRLKLRSIVVRLGALVLFGAAVSAISVIALSFVPLPEGMLDRSARSGVVIVDRNAVPLRYTRSGDGSDSRWVPYAEIDTDIINAFVAVEDQRFWEHAGIDLRAIMRAAGSNVLHGRVVSGASTVTMQLVRILNGRGSERSIGRKAREAVLALRLERHLSKQEIMEQYLNRIFLGQATAGVASATALYFGASASEVSAAQAATLAGIAHAPSRDNPHTSVDRARTRRNYALRRMQQMGFVMREDADRAIEEPIATGGRHAPFLAPHFTTRVLSWSGVSDVSAGLGGTADVRIETSIDSHLQEAIESEVRHTVDVLRDRDVMHAAVVVLNNTTGEVLAWVGSPDFWADDDGQNDMVVSPRQPGSALKPFLFGLALDRGYTAATVLPDIPISFGTAAGPYSPRNYDRRFRGPVRAREALASSYNVPAVVLAERLGVASFLQTLHLAGFESLDGSAEHYGLGLALGNGDVTLIELANAYRALANGGEWRAWNWRPAARGEETGGVAWEEASGSYGGGGSAPAADSERRVMSPAASAILLDILSDPVARIPGFGVATPFDFPFPVAVKTGTSRHFSDNWAVAATRSFTVAVWAGNFSGKPMEGVSGVSGAGPLLHRTVMLVAQRVDPGALTPPAATGAVPVQVCALSGMRATDKCASLREWFVSGSEPQERDTWERNGTIVLPDEFAEWSQSGIQDVAVLVRAPVTSSHAHFQEGFVPAADSLGEGTSAAAATVDSRFRVLSPLDGDRYSIPPGIESRYATIPLRVTGAGSDSVTWSVDGAAFQGSRWQLIAGPHRLVVRSSRGDSVVVTITVQK